MPVHPAGLCRAGHHAGQALYLNPDGVTLAVVVAEQGCLYIQRACAEAGITQGRHCI
ncbi:MAG: hypothetical protein U0L91_01275 [Gemmiger sp.]|uniref:hypothetical protein n=1 Tax=Gemmiger sp. TaxID=2049027 RepID=UPI002E773405|nr:hypothetical protein [Gemmiger sp.]MEE0799890.1 hypothetical protein [Gemmiger sp.]